MPSIRLFLANLLFVGLYTGCADPPPSATVFEEQVVVPNRAAEIAAIKTVIIAETTAFEAENISGMLDTRTDPFTTIQDNVQPNFIISRTASHTEARQLLEGYLSDPSNHMKGEVERSEWIIHLDPGADMAWVTFRARADFTEGSFRTEEIRVLEKIDGKWKIALISTLVHRDL